MSWNFARVRVLIFFQCGLLQILDANHPVHFGDLCPLVSVGAFDTEKLSALFTAVGRRLLCITFLADDWSRLGLDFGVIDEVLPTFIDGDVVSVPTGDIIRFLARCTLNDVTRSEHLDALVTEGMKTRKDTWFFVCAVVFIHTRPTLEEFLSDVFNLWTH